MALKIKNQPTWVSSVPMKMRRIRVRSLLAGCISCLRCEQTSGLTCRSSPFASPRTAVLSARLSSRSAGRPILSSFFLLFLFLLLLLLSRLLLFYPLVARRQTTTNLFDGIVSVHIHFISGAYLRCLSPYLSLRRTVVNIGLKARGQFRIHTL